LADKPDKNDADVQFKKLQRAQDGKKAMSEYEAEIVASRLKTERLRALRLARDAAEKAAPTAKPAAPAKKKPAKKKGATSATLSAWLKDQRGSGRES
jgi:hypothetical protein